MISRYFICVVFALTYISNAEAMDCCWSEGCIYGGTRLWFLRGEEITHRIYIWCVDSGEERQVYEFSGSVNFITRSALGLIACLEMTMDDSNEWPQGILKILTVDGCMQHIIRGEPQVGEYCWSPDGKALVYTSGPYKEAHSLGYVSTGLYVFDVTSGISKKIGEGGYNPFWAFFDGKVYYINRLGDYGFPGCVVALDVTSGETVKTEYRSNYFSPRGTYYLVKQEEFEPFAVYRRGKNEPLTVIPKLVLSRLAAICWLSEREVLCFDNSGRGRHASYSYVVDVETGEVRQTRNQIHGAIREGVVAVFHADGKLGTEEIKNMSLVDPSELPLNSEERRLEERKKQSESKE